MPELKIDPHKSWLPLREKASEIENINHKKRYCHINRQNNN